MQERLNRPQRFGEILDTVFTLSRNQFINFLKIFVIVVGPIYVLQALVRLASGVSFFRELGTGGSWIEQTLRSFFTEEGLPTNVEGDFMTTFISLAAALLLIIAQVAVLYAVNEIRQGHDFTVNEVIKRAFSKFWPLLRAGILLFIIAFFGITIIAIIMGIVIGVIVAISGVLGAIFSFFLVIGLLALGIFLFVRFYFYSAAIAFGDNAIPSFGTSWRLTGGRVWFLIGFAIVFLLIIGTVNGIFEGLLGGILGNSVLFGLLINGVTLVTTMITSVGFSVVYFDLFVRHDSTQLKEMIAEYDEHEV